MNIQDFTVSFHAVGKETFGIVRWPGTSGIETHIRVTEYIRKHNCMPTNNQILEWVMKDIKLLREL